MNQAIKWLYQTKQFYEFYIMLLERRALLLEIALTHKHKTCQAQQAFINSMLGRGQN